MPYVNTLYKKHSVICQDGWITFYTGKLQVYKCLIVLVAHTPMQHNSFLMNTNSLVNLKLRAIILFH